MPFVTSTDARSRKRDAPAVAWRLTAAAADIRTKPSGGGDWRGRAYQFGFNKRTLQRALKAIGTVPRTTDLAKGGSDGR